jgi:hypothetical protein
MSNTTTAGVPAASGRRLVSIGVVLALAGPAGYAAQIVAHRLLLPWYLPISGTVGAILVAASLWRARGRGRIVSLVLVLLLAGAEWAVVLMTRLPAYTGPVAVGRPFPSFTSARADGTSFSARDLRGDETNVLVFFRGRW